MASLMRLSEFGLLTVSCVSARVRWVHGKFVSCKLEGGGIHGTGEVVLTVVTSQSNESHYL